MAGVRKHVNDAGRLEDKALLINEQAGVTRECPRVAGHVDKTRGAGPVDPPNDILGAASCRVQEDAVEVLPEPRLAAINGGEVRLPEFAIVDAIAAGIGARPANLVRFAFDTENVSRAPCQRQ